MVVAATSVSEINRTLEGLTHLLPYRQVGPTTPVGTVAVVEIEKVKLVLICQYTLPFLHMSKY